jgi:hypothetical protein
LDLLFRLGGRAVQRSESSVATLDELVSQGLLVSLGDGYRFAQEALR